jgi:hypothetical protein
MGRDPRPCPPTSGFESSISYVPVPVRARKFMPSVSVALALEVVAMISLQAAPACSPACRPGQPITPGRRGIPVRGITLFVFGSASSLGA